MRQSGLTHDQLKTVWSWTLSFQAVFGLFKTESGFQQSYPNLRLEK